jgi:DNA polymerase I
MMDDTNDPARPRDWRAEAAETAELDANVKQFAKDQAKKREALRGRVVIKNPGSNRLEAARYYRDSLQWDVLPLAGSKKGGKRPLILNYRRWSRDQLDSRLLRKHFGPGKSDNLGLIVRAPHVIVDLDSKEDQGASAQEWLISQTALKAVPRERTGGGYHLHFICRDLPEFKKRDGSAYQKALVSTINAQVTAELFFEGLNVVLSPSVHHTGALYEWDVTGVLTEISWAGLQSLFGFQEVASQTERKSPGSSNQWTRHYKGELTTLNIVQLAQELQIYGCVISTDEGKHTVKCPWFEQHGDNAEGWSDADSSSVIFEPKNGALPGFSCFHQQHGPKGLQQLLAWAESKITGVVDKHCSRSRLFVPGEKTEDGRVRILLPTIGRPVGSFASEVADAVAPQHKWFVKDNIVVEPRSVSPNEKLTYFGIAPITATEICTAVEQFVETGKIISPQDMEPYFAPLTMTEPIGRQLLSAPQFINGLPRIARVLECQLPVVHNNQLVLVSRGYDKRFATFTRHDAPEISDDLPLGEAKAKIATILEGFPWKGAQDLTHAVARLVTPFCRGLMGWSARTPLWFFNANRPRAGKDYLNGVTQIIYSGYASEDAALNRDREEVRKRITTALLSGRRSMHFANCRDKLDQAALEQAITAPMWVDRILGKNQEVQLANEMEFSLSANVGVSYTPDFDARVRKIRLAYPDEDPNARIFRNPYLHGWVLLHRAELLSAVFAFVREWFQNGQPDGPTPFASFPEWARIVGGITHFLGFGDPCLPHEVDGSTGDELTEAMRVLFTVCYQAKPDEWIEKKTIYELIEDNQEDNDALNFFGDFSENSRRSDQTRLGKNLHQFTDRILNGILLKRRDAGQKGRTDRAHFRFTKPSDAVRDLGPQVHAAFFGGEAKTNTNKGTSANIGDFGDVPQVGTSGGDQAANPRVDGERAAGKDQYDDGRRGSRSRPSVVPDKLSPIILTDASDLQRVADSIRNAVSVAFDLETYGHSLNPWKGEIRILSLAVPNARPWLLDLRGIGYDLGPLKAVLEATKMIGHNAKFDSLWLRVKCQLELQELYCTCTASRLLTAGTDEENGLAACLATQLDIHLPKDQACSDWGTMLLTDDQIAYCADDVRYLHNLQIQLDAQLHNEGLREVADLEMALLPVIVNVEAAGFAIDRPRLQSINDEARRETQNACAEIHQLFPSHINPASPAQLLSALKEQGVNLPDTSEETLRRSADTKFVPIVLRYRAAEKRQQLTRTLLDSIQDDARIHGQFNPTGTATGRFSSKEPNMQNVERGPVRECFIAQPGNVLIVADYSQIELRLAAAIAPEPAMINAYKHGTDLHVRTASVILNKTEASVTQDERRLAKGINFGLLYGQRADGLVRYLKTSYDVTITKREAERFISRFFRAYKGLQRWHKRAARLANERSVREVRTSFGRRRLLPKDNWWQRYTSLLNTPIQGGSNDGLKLAMRELARDLGTGARLISTVHDELIIECNADGSDSVKALVVQTMKSTMEKLYPSVPIEIEAKVCASWADK